MTHPTQQTATQTAPALHQELARLGYVSREHSFRGREIFHAESGQVVGVMDAAEAWEFVAREAPPKKSKE